MRRPLSYAIAILLVLIHAAPASAGLREQIETALSGTKLGGAVVAVSVRDVDSARQLVDRNSAVSMIPASNFKLLTTGAALHVLGPDFRFETRLVQDGDRLIVYASGDPAFADPELLEVMEMDGEVGIDIERFLDLWVTSVTGHQIESISEIVVDDRIFDREFVHGTWPVDQLNRSYCAEVGGMNFHANVLHFFPRPANGRPNLHEFNPRAPWVVVNNRASSRAGGNEQSNAWISRKPDKNELSVYGNVKARYRTPIAVTLHDPPVFFGKLLEDRLRRAGVTVERSRVAALNDSFGGGRLVAPIVSTPISTVVTRCNRDSENLYAEALLKRIGYEITGDPGSWSNGAAALRQVVHQRLEQPRLTSKLRVSDGSGLSRNNGVSAELMTAWLNSFHADKRLSQVFIGSLAVAGESGTLKKRFREVSLQGAIVRGKSGYINEVSCLSGYVTLPDGPTRSFSILVNDLEAPGSVRLAKRLQEQIVAIIAKDMARVEEVTLGSD